ncbi:cyclin-dependent kinase inhibitor 1B isoform 1-T1 [Guaruba guarouba]
MSNVRISNGSPTLERMEARQSEYPKPSACRNLFGPVNHEELNRDLKKHRQEMEEACQRKWNFDFQNYKPLEGRYEWQAVEKGSSPDFYFRPPRLLKAVCKSAGRQSLDVNGNCQTVVFVGSQGISEDTHCVGQKTDVSENQTDFAEQCTGQRKRPATDGNVPLPARAAPLLSACPAAVSAGAPGPFARATRGLDRRGLCPAGHRLREPLCPPPPLACESPDSSPQNKRANTTEEGVSKASPSANSVEQTPKKSTPRRHQT